MILITFMNCSYKWSSNSAVPYIVAIMQLITYLTVLGCGTTIHSMGVSLGWFIVWRMHKYIVAFDRLAQMHCLWFLVTFTTFTMYYYHNAAVLQ